MEGDLSKIGRRSFVSGAGVCLAGLAGCLETRTRNPSNSGNTTDSISGNTSNASQDMRDVPDAVYVPSHIDGMKMVGGMELESYQLMLSYTTPHRFWTVTGDRLKEVKVRDKDTLHFMASLTDKETGYVLPSSNVSATFRKDGDVVDSRDFWPMLSENMGFHYGDNIQLPQDGEYNVEIEVTPPTAKKQGGFDGRLGGIETGKTSFELTRKKLKNISYKQLDNSGTRGAADPMKNAEGYAPEESNIAGFVGSKSSGDADFLVFTRQRQGGSNGSQDVSNGSQYMSGNGSQGEGGVGGGGRYLGVIPATPYNRFVLPRMAISGVLKGGSRELWRGEFEPVLDTEIGYHYAALVPSGGDGLEVTVDAPPQLARHEGYETAFLDFGDMSFDLGS